MSAVIESDRAVLRVVVGLILMVPFLFCVEVTSSNHRSFNLRAMSGEGLRVSGCLAKTPTCRWEGWQTSRQLRSVCPGVDCIPDVERYAFKRVEGGDGVVALGVGAFQQMMTDTWLAVPGEEPIHCIDRTHIPGVLTTVVRDIPRVIHERQSPDPRCATVLPLPDPGALRRALIPG
jgi:hypothetical protein